MSASTFLANLTTIADRYRGFIIDQWGVLHDGAEPYPGAIDCLTALRDRNKHVVLLSNTGKRAAFNRMRLADMGYGPALYDAVVTSGEACWQALKDRRDPEIAAFGRRCYLWSRGSDDDHLEGLGLKVVTDAEEADFFYLAGVKDHLKIEDFVEALDIGARRGLPLICGNPDVIAIHPNGGRGMAPGGVARHYEKLGGRAIFVGKPHRPVYELCLEKLRGIPKDEIVGIGDSLEHDIAGGNGIGIDTALLMQGVHREDFAGAGDEPGKQVVLDRLSESYDARPRWVLENFTWL